MRWCALLAAACALAVLPVHAVQDNDTCLGCHDVAGFDESEHAPFECGDCHAGIADGPHDEAPVPRVANSACAVCHAEAVAEYQHGAHGKSQAAGTKEAASCQDCHGNLHAVVGHADPKSPMHWSQQAATCARCHANLELVEKFNLPVARPVEAYLQSAHARAVRDGKHGAVCGDCHGAHDIASDLDPASPLAPRNVAGTCGACHEEISAAYRDSVHGEALGRGIREAPTCIDCHGEHKILGTGEPSSPIFAANIPGETCGRCHANERLNEKYGLRVGKASAFHDTYHGLALRAGQLTAANCASCHGVHDIRPSRDPRSHVHQENLAATCGKCHPGAGASIQLGPVHGDRESTGARAAAWVRVIYLWLIGFTIGGMLLHNLLDLARKMRHRPPPPPPIPPGTLERMPRALRWQHASMMISFPTLVYTGFALTYPEAWWAVPLLRWESHLGLRGLLHRGAAIVMLVGLASHLFTLATQPRLRACMRAMLPGWRDVRIAWGTVAYYLHLRSERPRSGKLSYIEKAEYWAFLWGTVVMALTGFVLWFENLTLRYLPAWVPDVATALHFYEAVLATLAILVWHFYWVIFDPEVYPMDWTWWDGQSPPARVAERRDDADEPS